MSKILDKIDSPRDLKTLSLDELGRLATEIRGYILDVVSKNGGHLSANLGVVELTLALHRVFDTPIDKIVWDVGHQSYTHKIITGRRERFRSLRQRGGILGFPSREESEYDTYNTGHASTALSAALGMAVARDKKGQKHTIIAVVGDGSLTGGVSWEALNQIGHLRTPAHHRPQRQRDVDLAERRGHLQVPGLPGLGPALPAGQGPGQDPAQVPARAGLADHPGRPGVEELVKKVFFPGSGFRGARPALRRPVQGHSLRSLIEVFEDAKKYEDGPILIHCVTRKGRGYVPAQDNPDHFHGAAPFNVESGESSAAAGRPSYSEVFGKVHAGDRPGRRRSWPSPRPCCEGTGLTAFARSPSRPVL